MTTTLYAQPYDVSASGFYFKTTEEFTEKAKTLRNSSGEPVEEFEIQFIDGEEIDCELAKAIGLSQANLTSYLECVERWKDWEKTNIIIVVGECGCAFEPDSDPHNYNVDVYHVETLRELAEQFVDDGLYGDIPEHLQNYIDYDAIARDLAADYSETTIAGVRLVYAN